jgi:hypothetical protein
MTRVGSPDFIRALGSRPCSRRHRVRRVTGNGLPTDVPHGSAGAVGGKV